MLIGVPKEIKVLEHRVGLTPSSVRELIRHGHKVIIQSSAGEMIDMPNEAYTAVGATILNTADQIYDQAEMIIKVKEPQPSEYTKLHENQILFSYLHLAADLEQTQGLINAKAIAIAFETITDKNGALPVLAPMSIIAGRISTQAGAHYLQMKHGGRGTLIGGAPGISPAKVTILGGGVCGTHAAKIALGMGANTTIMDINPARLAELDDIFSMQLNTIHSNTTNIEEAILESDLVIGAVLIPGAKAPKLVNKDLIKRMKKGAVVVDIAVDQGGCFETSHPTTHTDPIYHVDDVVHYCVSNMPAAFARTSTLSLNNTALPYILTIADKGYQTALLDDPHFASGLNVMAGKVTHKGVAESLNLAYCPPADCLSH